MYFHIVFKVSAMVQAISWRLLTAETRVRSQVIPYETCGVQTGKGTGVSPITALFRLLSFHEYFPHVFIYMFLLLEEQTFQQSVSFRKSGNTLWKSIFTFIL